MVGQHAGHHRLSDRRGADADAGIVAALGAQFDLVAEAVDAAHRREDGAGGLDDQPADDVLAGRDAAQNAAGVVAEESGSAILHAHLVGIILAAHGGGGEAVTDLHALHGVDAHQGLGKVGVAIVVDRVAQSDGDAGSHHFDHRAARAAALAHIVEIAFPALCGLAVGTPARVVAGGRPVPFAAVDLLGSGLHHCATDADAVSHDLAGNGARRDSHGRLARRLTDAATIVAHAVLLAAGGL